MILHMRHTLWTGIRETNVNVITSATRTHALIIRNINYTRVIQSLDRIAVTGADIFTHISIGGLLLFIAFQYPGKAKTIRFSLEPCIHSSVLPILPTWPTPWAMDSGSSIVIWGKAPPGESAPPSNYEFTYASGPISWLTMHHVGKVFMSKKTWAE